jgi:JmjC domain
VVPHRWHHAGAFDDVLSLADVDRALTGAGLRRPAVRAVRDGTPLPPWSYSRRARIGGSTVVDLIDVGRLLDLFASGATIVLQGLHRWWAPAARFCRDLEVALGHAVQANAYLTPPGAAGLAAHHDTHDVFVLQVAGAKHWVVREPVLADPLPRQHSEQETAAAQPVLFEADMVPGDALYLPRGFVHSATAQEGVSLHLTVGILATTVHDVLAEVMALADDDPAFRRMLPAGWAFDGERATGAVKAALGDLVDWLSRLDAGDVAARLRDRFVANRVPVLAGQLLEVAGLGAIDDGTVLRRRVGTIATLTPGGPGGEPLRLVLGDRTVSLPAALEPAVRRLTDGRAHRVGDLTDLLDGPSRLVLARRLVREGALVTSPDAAPGDG